ncbi:MAG: saccharopine dehydrogenase NADP-binding domain-containing protein [Planctomycetes bacterium]|nr:saccharopine dehydrogenase NADP-binding domain-containing protein [Planctomycetota bacterium]
MRTVAVLGAGKIGRMLAHMLGHSGDYQVRVADVSLEAARRAVRDVPNTQPFQVDFDDERTLEPVLSGAAAVLSCCPFECNPFIAEQAVKYDLHYLDLTEDIETTRSVLRNVERSSKAFIPQCGLAPGFITITGVHLMKPMEEVESLKLRVGALPRYPSNMLKYNLTWSTEGLINEYGNPCEVLRDGEPAWVQPLEGLEELMIDGARYEAFNTSGGLGSLCQSLQGKVKNLNYRSIRYPGHNLLIRFLYNELKMNQDRDTLRTIFERSLPATFQDVVVIYVSAIGKQQGQYVERTYARTVTHQTIAGSNWSAIQITTAAGIAGVLDLLFEGHLPQRGFVRQEDVDYQRFIQNRFGKYYA